MICPRCKESGLLNCHGRLRNQSGDVRGTRFWCSTRRKSRPGCGHSFTIYLANILPRYSVQAQVLCAFFSAWSQLGGDVLLAWEQAQTGFSTDSAYRWIRRLLGCQSEVRTRLCRARPPPPTRRDGILADLFEHLDLVLDTTNFIEGFQLRFQRPWPMGA